MTGQNPVVVVIGGGPAGYAAAIRAARLGALVTLVEKDRLGGTCLNSGCIPTKALLHTAALYRAAQNGSACGVVADVRLNFAQAHAHKGAIIGRLRDDVRALMDDNKIKVLYGKARFISKTRLTVETDAKSEEIIFDKAIIACGAVSAQPGIEGADAACVVDSEGALSFEKVPASMIIIGGGIVGVELATIYNSFGSKVTVIEMADEILPSMDAELAAMLRKEMAKSGVEFITSAKVLSIAEKSSSAIVEIQMQDGAVKARAGIKILVAVGRSASSQDLGLDAAGIATTADGWIITNSQMRTNMPHIYAAGDCRGEMMLAHAAVNQGEIAAENIFGGNIGFDASTIATCVYTTPELASVGLTEKAALAQDLAIKIGRYPLSTNAKALIMNGGVGMVKMITGARYGEILGCHILGPRATDLIGEPAFAIGMEALNEDIGRTIHPRPSISEAIREAALAVVGQSIYVADDRK